MNNQFKLTRIFSGILFSAGIFAFTVMIQLLLDIKENDYISDDMYVEIGISLALGLFLLAIGGGFFYQKKWARITFMILLWLAIGIILFGVVVLLSESGYRMPTQEIMMLCVGVLSAIVFALGLFLFLYNHEVNAEFGEEVEEYDDILDM